MPINLLVDFFELIAPGLERLGEDAPEVEANSRLELESLLWAAINYLGDDERALAIGYLNDFLELVK